MKILILSDIHGNYHALDAVLKQVTHDVLVCCGDIVVDFPFPEECITRLRDADGHCCIGNNDCFVADDLTPSQHLKEPYLQYGEALDRAVAITQGLISSDAKTFLAGLNREHHFSLGGVAFYLNHTAPGLPVNQYMHLDMPAAELARIYRGIQADVLITGHTHIPYVKRVGRSLLINPGSIGEARDGDTRASYATFDTSTGQVELGRLAYDMSRTRNRLKQLNFPNYSLYCLKHGRLPEDPDDDGS